MFRSKPVESWCALFPCRYVDEFGTVPFVEGKTGGFGLFQLAVKYKDAAEAFLGTEGGSDAAVIGADAAGGEEKAAKRPGTKEGGREEEKRRPRIATGRVRRLRSDKGSRMSLPLPDGPAYGSRGSP